MALQRTEDQILSREPFDAKLGSETYKIKPLGILKQRQWREKLAEEVNAITEGFSQPTTNKNALTSGLASALLRFPEKIVDMVFLYAPDLDQQKIMEDEETTEEQFAKVFGDIMSVAFPFLASLQLMTTLMKTSSSSTSR